MIALLDHIHPVMAYICTVASMALGAIAGKLEAEQEISEMEKEKPAGIIILR